MKQLWIWVLLIIPLGELHLLWHSVDIPVHPFLFNRAYTIDIEWVVARIGWMLQFTIISWVAYKISCRMPNMGELPLALKTIFYFSLLDIGMYFVNGKMGWYAVVYYVLAVFLILRKIKK